MTRLQAAIIAESAAIAPQTSELIEAAKEAVGVIEQLHGILSEAALQIEYLHEKFAVTGSGNAVLSRIRAVLDPAQRDMAEGGESRKGRA